MKLLELFNPSSRQKIMEGIDHPEDLIIQQGSKGADRVIEELSKLESDPSTISVKWDGLPALVWGRDKQGVFHLVDKHMFDKISKGKMEFATIQDYDEGRGANRSSLWEKERIMKPALEAATPQVRDQYWFGDFMYAGTPPTKDGKFVVYHDPILQEHEVEGLQSFDQTMKIKEPFVNNISKRVYNNGWYVKDFDSEFITSKLMHKMRYGVDQ